MKRKERLLRWSFVPVAMLFTLVAFLPAPAAGQGSTASIIGQVTDASGGALPGVTVTATSPALQVPQVTDVTNATGEYRLPQLPIGVYNVKFELTGFKAHQQPDVRLTLGFTARIDPVLGLEAVQETVSVSGRAPLVDVNSSAGSTLVTRELLDLTPTTRNGIGSVLELSPGVRPSRIDIGGNQAQENPGGQAWGQSGQWFTYDGIATMEAFFWSYNTLEEVRVQTVGTDAEFGLRGLRADAVVKAGGNNFHGRADWNQSSPKFQSDNLDEELRALGFVHGESVETQYDIFGDIGGRILRDKLWFYFGVNRRNQTINVLGSFQPDGSPAPRIAREVNWTNKTSWQATPSHRFVFLGMRSGLFERKAVDEFRSWDSREEKPNTYPILKGQWEGQFGNTLASGFQYGWEKKEHRQGSLSGILGRTDLETERVTGDFVGAGEHSLRRQMTTNGYLSWYKPTATRGNHDVKVGFEQFRSKKTRAADVAAFNYHLLYEDGEPFEVAFLNHPVEDLSIVDTLAIYGKDSWTIAQRLTVNAGLRYSRDTGGVPAVERVTAGFPSDVTFPARSFPEVNLPVWHTVAPRLHFAYDLSGDGRTALKGGWGRYYQQRAVGGQTSGAVLYDPNGITYGIFEWSDLNGNNDWDVGESDRDPNADGFVEFTGLEFGPRPRTVVNPDEPQQHWNEYMVTLEREVRGNMAVRATGVYTQVRNIARRQNNFRPFSAYNIPVTQRDPGPDGIRGNGDDPGGTLTYFEFSPTLAGGAFEEFSLVHDPTADQSFAAFEVTGTKRLSNRWQTLFSFAATKKNIPHALGDFNPNVEINTADHTWDRIFKALGTYILPWDILLSGNFQHWAGVPFARQVRVTGGATIPAFVMNAEEIGTRRSPNINLLTARVEKRFTLFTTHKLGVQVNLYNALNSNTATTGAASAVALNARSGADFLRPRGLMLPRIAEFSATYSF